MQTRTLSRLAWLPWIVSMAAILTPLAIQLSGRIDWTSGGPGAWAPTVSTFLFILTFATVGAVLGSKRPQNPIGWLLSAAALFYSLGTVAELLKEVSLRWSDWMNNWVWGLGLFTAMFVLLLFPSGRLPSRRWRPVAWLGWAAVTLTTLGNLFAPGVLPDTHSVNPLGVGGPLGAVFDALQAAFAFVLFTGLAALASLVFRYRRADPVEREQLRWLVYAVGLIILAVIAGSVAMEVVSNGDLATNIQNAIVSLALAGVPLAIGFAVLKYRLYDIDIVINKTLVFGALAAFITAVYVGIVVGIGEAIGSGGSKPNLGLSILATAVVAVAFQPVRARVQRFANRLVYGKRATPYEVLAEFSHRMAGTYASDDILPRMARILAEGTGAKGAMVWLKVSGDLHPAASWPEANGEGHTPRSNPDLSVPVLHQGEELGALSITKSAGDRITPAEEKLTTDLASQAGLVLRNVRLIEELKASRVRLVQAQDEERRRIERNIHDGAQQQLVAIGVKLGLARRFTEDETKLTSVLTDLQEETNQALQDLRDLARGIFPPLLADQGLVAALQSQARKAAIPVSVQADGISRYSQDAEAAVYFCVLEALQNVSKYASASQATVKLSHESHQLVFEVTDDGAGFDSSTTSHGTGLQGMADRLAALGGAIEVTSEPGRGTTVTGHLPIDALQAVG